jgi:transcriptional regulator with XRE-family HTH domain
MATEPPVRRQLAGAALRRYREGFGATLADAAEVLGCSPSRISRIEAGERGIRPDELPLLLTEYGIDDEDVHETLLAIASPRSAPGWWSSCDRLTSADQQYTELEALSTQACYYAPLRVPELLQTPSYAESQHAATDAPDPAVEATLARQEELLSGARALRVVIGEAALHQAAGRPPVMRQQAAHLAALAESTRVDLRVVPFTALMHPAPELGALSIPRFGTASSGINVACLPGAATGQILTGTHASGYVHAWEQLRACALTPEESAALLRQFAA